MVIAVSTPAYRLCTLFYHQMMKRKQTCASNNCSERDDNAKRDASRNCNQEFCKLQIEAAIITANMLQKAIKDTRKYQQGEACTNKLDICVQMGKQQKGYTRMI